MVRHVFDNSQCAHVWAAQTQSEGRSHNGNLYFRGATIYNYRDTWPLASFMPASFTIDGKRVVVTNAEKYSITTTQRAGDVRGALRGLPVFELGCVNRQTAVAWIEWAEATTWTHGADYLPANAAFKLTMLERAEGIKGLAFSLAKPRKDYYSYPAGYLSTLEERLAHLEAQFAAYIEFSNLIGCPVEAMPALDIEALSQTVIAAFAKYNDPKQVKARAKASHNSVMPRLRKAITAMFAHYPSWRAGDKLDKVAREALAQFPNEAARELRAYQVLLAQREAWDGNRPYRHAPSRPRITAQQWKDGVTGVIDDNGFDIPTFVRRKKPWSGGLDIVETSRGAEVPFKAAVGLYLMAAEQRAKGSILMLGNEAKRVGHFALTQIDANGNCTVGCHHLSFEEMERLAIREVPHLVKPRYPLPMVA